MSTNFINPRQVVAFNVRTLRRQLGWDQATLCRRLEEAGLPWSTTTLSAAEATWAGRSKRERHFTASELMSLALAFDVSIARLFRAPTEMPSGDLVEPDVPCISLGDADRGARLTPKELNLLVRGHDQVDMRGPDGSVIELKRSPNHATVSPDEAYSYLAAVYEQIKPLFPEGGEEPTKENK